MAIPGKKPAHELILNELEGVMQKMRNSSCTPNYARGATNALINVLEGMVIPDNASDSVVERLRRIFKEGSGITNHESYFKFAGAIERLTSETIRAR
jgi:hypothetical protein